MTNKRTAQAPNEPAPRAAIYLRVSTDEQVLGLGLDVQAERTRAMIAAKGWQYVTTYKDEGISGTKGAEDRPGLAAMLDAARSGRIDAVVVLALDRLGRKTSLVLGLVEQLATAGVQLVSCKESLDTSTPQGQFVLTMFAALAALERDLIVQRTTDGRNALGRQTGERGGRLPLGYKRAARKKSPVEVDEEGKRTVRLIFRLRRSGMTLREIAAHLTAEGITPPRGGTRWSHSAVQAVLDQEAIYRGGKRGDSAMRWPRLL